MVPVRLALIIALMALAAPASAASYYAGRPDDPAGITVPRGDRGARGDGLADDTAAVQSAIDAVQQSTGEGIVLVPEGRYRLTRTLFVWPGIRIIGYGPSRPAFVLGASTPGFQDPATPGYMVFFAGRRPADGSAPPDATPGTFYSALSNVDLEIAEGNPGAVGVRARYAQHCFTSHVEFRIGSGLAGVHEGGNVAEDVRFVGGEYGIWTGTPSPGWQYTLLDASFEGQRRAAIRERAAGLTLIRPRFIRVPTAVEIEAGAPDDLWISDARFEEIPGPAVVIGLAESARTQINMARVACRRVPIFVAFRETGRTLAGPGERYVVSTFSHGLHYDGLDDAGGVETVFEAAPVAALPAPAESDLVPLPPVDTWVNARALGARGDGTTDDTEALRRAIASHRTVYVPTGRYLVTDTLALRDDTVLIGLHPSATQLVIPDRAAAFQGTGAAKGLIETPRGGRNVVIGIGLYTNGINPRAAGAIWRSGPRSMMNDVRFLGGHGTTGLDGRRQNPYNNTHTADPELNRRWDSQYPSLWVTDGGGGTFFDLWTPSTFASAGMLVSDTETSGRVYQMSSEHHVRYEVQLHRVSHWQFHALQTEEERGESGFALPLEIRDSSDVLLTNFHAYRVISSDQPFPWTVTLSGSRDIRFRGMHDYSNSKVAFDSAVYDADRRIELRQREFAWLDVAVSGHAAGRPEAANLERGSARLVTQGFHNAAGAAAGPNGDVYFVDARWQRIHRWNVRDARLTTVADAPLMPVNLAFDTAGRLLVVSYAGTGTGAIYTFDPGQPGEAPVWLQPRPAQPVARATFVLPVGDWRLVSGSPDGRLPDRTHQYVAPDGATVISATGGFVEGQVSWGVKSADLIRAFGLQSARTGERVYLTSEAEAATYTARVAEDGGLTDVRLFVQQGGEGVTVDRSGRVYIAAGDVFIYSPQGVLVDRIDVPERPTGLVFGGPDRRTLFITARHGLYAAEPYR